MIDYLYIDGFKSLRKVHLNIKPLTVLVGLNSSGKSSVLQFLQMLKQTTEETGRGRGTINLISEGKLINLGSYSDIVYGQDETTKISFIVKGKRKQGLNAPFGSTTDYSYSVVVDSQGLYETESCLSSGKITIKGKFSSRTHVTNARFVAKYADEKMKTAAPQRKFEFVNTNLIGYPFDSAGISGEFDNLLFNQYYKFLLAITQDLQDFSMVPAIRGIVSTSYPLDDQPSTDFTDVNDLQRQEMKLASTIVYKRAVMEKKIDKWIKRVTGIQVKGILIPNKKAAIEANRKFDVNIVNEGFGSNQLVHLFAQIAIASPSSLVGIEEPEVHLHPKAQSELAGVLIDISKEENLRLVMTTHSEHILYRILIEIAKGNITSDNVAIYHFKLNSEGVSEVEELAVNKRGQLNKGIPDFLETDIEEFQGFLEGLKAP